MIREFVRGWRRWGLLVAWQNLRFQVGYKVGGFTYAYNYGPEELRYCAACGEDVPRRDG